MSVPSIMQGTIRIRATGSIMLIVWLAALVLCSAECLLDSGHCSSAEGGKSCSGGTALPKAPTPENDKNNGSCDTLESSRPSFNSVNPIPPAGLALYDALPHIQLLIDDSDTHSACLRQRQRPDRLCTPEVYLGSALHSLAPPSLHS